MLAQLMLVLDATVVNVALPHIATDLHFTRAELSWVLNGYAVAFGGLLLLGGRIGDVFGRRRTFLVGVAAFTLFSLLGGLATSPLLLVIARALQGLGAAFAAPSVLALITTSAKDDGARNRALALFSAVASMGGALGLILGGLLTDTTSWRWTLFINVPIGVVVLIAVPRLVAETPRRPGRFDILGAVTATGGAVAIVWGLIQAGDVGWSSPRTIGGLVVGAALIAVLAVTERRVAHPLLRPQLLRSPSRVAALAAMAATYGGMLAMFFLMVQYLEDDLHLTPMVTGLAFLPMPLSIFAMSRIVPRLVERFGAVRLVIFGTALRVVAFLPLTQLNTDTPFAIVIACPAVHGNLGRHDVHAAHDARASQRRTRARRVRVGTFPDNAATGRRRRTGHRGFDLRGLRSPRRLPDRRAGRVLVGDHPLRPRAGSRPGVGHQTSEGL